MTRWEDGVGPNLKKGHIGGVGPGSPGGLGEGESSVRDGGVRSRQETRHCQEEWCRGDRPDRNSEPDFGSRSGNRGKDDRKGRGVGIQG